MMRARMRPRQRRRAAGVARRRVWYGASLPTWQQKHPPKKTPPRPSASASWPSSVRSKSSPDPLSRESLKKLGIRLGIPAVVLWALVIAFGGTILKIVMGAVTVGVLALLYWAVSRGRKQKAVAEILQKADTKEGRKEAIEKLDSDFKKGDLAAAFAKSQLQMQEDPRAALKTLEAINLSKVLAHEADEARAQRAMIHLILGETDEARALVDPIDLSRHKEAKNRASLTAIIGEAWARSGQAKRAVELLDKLDPNDEAYVDLKPQLLRSRAFAFAWASDTKQMKHTLKLLRALNVQYLMGFITKKKNPMGVASRGVHPLLEKEAFDMVMKSGAIPRRMEVRRG